MTNKTFLVLFTWFENQEIMYLKCLYLRHCLLHCTVKSPCCSGSKSVNNCINVRGVRSVDL